MKIAVYVPAWPPGSVANGILTFYGNLLPELRLLGHEVYIITPQCATDRPESHVVIPDMRTIRFRLNHLFARAVEYLSPGYDIYRTGATIIVSALRSLIRDVGIDVMEMEESFGWHSPVSRAVDVPVITRLHGPHFLNGNREMIGHQTQSDLNRVSREGRALRQAKAVTAPSKNVIDETMAHYDVKWPLSKVIHNPVQPISVRNRWDLSNCDRNEVLFVGRFDLHKGGDIMIDAFARLAQSRPQVRLTFVGSDPGIHREGEARVGIHEFIEKTVPSSIRDRIRYLGLRKPEEIGSLRRRAYVTVVCSRYENFPNTVLEAVAHGSPTVATNTGGIPEIVLDDRNGLLAAPANPDSLKARIEELLDDPDRAKRLADQAYEDAQTRFHPAKLARESVDFFANVVEQHH